MELRDETIAAGDTALKHTGEYVLEGPVHLAQEMQLRGFHSHKKKNSLGEMSPLDFPKRYFFFSIFINASSAYIIAR